MNKCSGLFISVLMSCYNADKWLSEAIDSVLKQTYGNFEFIIIDDGSTDNTSEIIKKYSDADSRIIFIKKNNTGLADSLNMGISKAKGEWIARLDADDISEPWRLEEQVTLVMKKPDIVFLGSGLSIINEDGAIVKKYKYPSSHQALLSNLNTSQKFPPHSSAFYRTHTARQVGGYRPRIRRSQDRDLWLRLSEVGKLAAIDKPLVRVRKHAGQVSHEEAGRRQLVDSRVSLVSYWLRHLGYSDPVDQDENTFLEFRSWMDQGLAQMDLFEYFKFKNIVLDRFKYTFKSPRALFFATKLMLGHPIFVFWFLRFRFRGEFFSQRLTREWIKNLEN